MDRFASSYADALSPKFPEVEFLLGADAAAVTPLLPGATVLFAFAPWITDEMLAAASRLEWLQALTTGVDNLWPLPALKPDTLITNARGVHGPQMSELAFLYMLALSRNWRGLQHNQAAAVWDRQPQRLLWRRTLVVVGLGVIAEDLARRANAFDMRVVGVSATPREVAGFDAVVSRDGLGTAVAEADFVVVLAPYSPATHHLIDAAVLGAMRPDAYLINLARGGVVDEAALLAALDAGAIAGAGLDVFATEPLPANSPWWTHPKVLLTPHLGGMSDVYEAQVMPILEHNIQAFLTGQPDDMMNRVARPPETSR
jgi:phosphoglycerate dehydrogenase-like enzyme